MKLTLETLWMHTTADLDCMLWMHSVNSTGYPQANVDGQSGVMVRRYIFLRLLQRQLGPRQRVTTSCGHKLCVNPAHLVRRTYSETLRRSYAEGGRRMNLAHYQRLGMQMSGSHMTPELLDRIRSEPDELSHAEVARRHGVSPTVAGRIRRGCTFRRARPVATVFEIGPTRMEP